MSRTIDVAMCINRMHFAGALAAIHSIASNAARPEDVAFHVVVGEGESSELLALLRRCFPEPGLRCEVREFSPSPLLASFLRAGLPFTYASYESQVMNFSRFYLHRTFPELAKTVYLDADLVVRGDVAELARLATLEKHLLAAVPVGTFNSWRAGLELASEHLGHVDFDQPVFNGGVYVTDLERWRERDVLAELEGWIRIQRRSPGDFIFGTQLILNLVFYRDFQHLPPEWNVRPLGNDDGIPEETLRSAKILHWAGRRKPWMPNGLYREYWIDYALDVEGELR